ncbi:hypothetical protein LOTGIDRAFT_235566 [Lottia gigantea]|uniref:Saposin A-type domain-containing protein n=1 Tax=Lottia gigantea TaxID=225164 RepID=V4BAI1_LOTGI|nr:hypothetical protein LOTGIDRAFT_235566 [Lottia gigantea]ESO85964.1 hypothetical protein LOTGIDRAFT_235566 [Lottia gigantea]
MNIWIVSTVCLIFTLSSVSAKNNKCNFPPDLWCSSEEIAASCQVTQQCSETSWLLKEKTGPVNFTLYYESLCPDCQQFIRFMLYPTYQKISSIMNLTLVPYGNARESRESSGRYKYDCQHGPQECVGNLIDTCSIYYLKIVEKYFPYIHCMEISQSDPLQAAKQCAQQFTVPLDKILSCANSSLGNSLEHEMAKKTDSLRPQHQYVPWVTLNGVHNEKIQNEAQNNLVKLICKTYQGAKKPEACNEFKVKKTNRCYK